MAVQESGELTAEVEVSQTSACSTSRNIGRENQSTSDHTIRCATVAICNATWPRWIEFNNGILLYVTIAFACGIDTP